MAHVLPSFKTSPSTDSQSESLYRKTHMVMEVNAYTFRFTSSKARERKPLLSTLEELSEFHGFQTLDKGCVEVPTVNSLWSSPLVVSL